MVKTKDRSRKLSIETEQITHEHRGMRTLSDRVVTDLAELIY